MLMFILFLKSAYKKYDFDRAGESTHQTTRIAHPRA